MLTSKISFLFAGGTGRLEPEGQSSGIFKRPIGGRVAVSVEGLAGDEHADRRVHGGPEKAVHHYAAENYAKLAQAFPQIAAALVPGSLGENISAAGLTEHTVHIGDIFQVGGILVQVSQPRSPCWKINHRFGVDRLSMHIAQQGITGWYYRVLRPGYIEPGDDMALVERQTDRFSIHEFWRVQSAHRPRLDDLEALAAVPGLAEGWKKRLNDRVSWLRSKQAQPHRRGDGKQG